MALKKAPKPIQFVPLDPNKCLPSPPIGGRSTGVRCFSRNCRSHGPHTTVYWEPKEPHLRHLIGTRCNFDNKYYRYYNKAHYSQELLTYNRLFQLSSQRIPLSNPQTHSANAPMDPQFLLDSFLHQLTPLMVQPAAPSNNEVTCQGYNQQFALNHSTRMNRGCPIKACSACCHKLNHDLPCVPHQTQAKKRKAKDTAKETNGTPQLTQDTDLTPVDHSLDNSVAPSTQAGRLFTRCLSPSELKKFRTISITKQAEERVLNDELSLAKKLVTMVVWSGDENDPLGSETWRVQANKWPLFSLDQSEELLGLIETRLGNDWKGGLRVWNSEEHNWVHIKLNTVELYPKDCKKILVIFPNIKATLCEGVDRHLASVAPMSQKAAMDICAMITPSNSQSIAHTIAPRIASSITPNKSQPNSAYSTPSHISESEEEVEVYALNKRLVKDTAVPNIQPLPSGSRRHGSNWPCGVNMRAMLQFLERSSKKAVSMKAAWEEQFQGTHGTYVSTTVSTYRSWLLKITLPKLTEYVELYGDRSIPEAKEYFEDLWAQCDTRPRKRARSD
ncbi:hypothetical protein DFH28DRAFT_1068160 [Melampsora americana]|nr:hypothetical protein DFH28DRAFT_1068160 [Melampsora americana]